ncbi:MAG TPA: hypothetical protein VEC13_01020 [Candidatus Paceibacterota bacterium]|nr:hypothetical protein [Candidatus Paceibacterota bacterium]
MIEARVFVSEIETARKILEAQNALFKGEYCCRDSIYSSVDPLVGIDQEFLRLRVNEKNIWNEKDVIVAVKYTDQKEIGIDSIVPFKQGFDSEDDAKNYIEDNFKGKYKFNFEFTRTGWQYDLGEDQVDLEKVDDLDNFYTIEFKSPTVEGLKKLQSLLNVSSAIEGPIAFHMKKFLKP